MPLEGMTINDYQDAISSFCLDNPDTTIFLVGEISHPGVSDLDFLVIDKVPKISNSVEPFLMGGNVIIMPREHLCFLNNIEKFKLQKLQGSISDVTIEKQLSKHFEIIEVLEWLPERILKCIKFQKSQIERKEVLLLHKSILRSIDNIAKITGNTYQFLGVDDVRNNDTISSKDILTYCTSTGMKAWHDFEVYVKDNDLLTGKATGTVNICDYYSFNDKFESLMLYYDVMSKLDCSLSHTLNERICLKTQGVSASKDFYEFAVKRWFILSEIYNWFTSRGIKKGMIKYGWFL